MSRMVNRCHNDMNLYAASVALLWSTAMHPAAVSRARAQEPLLPPSVALDRCQRLQGWTWLRGGTRRGG
jgi:hypothetical protein